MAIPRWTTADLDKARDDMKRDPYAGSTTPILDRYGFIQHYGPNGRVYIPAKGLNAFFSKLIGKFAPVFQPFNDLPGPHPWEAETQLKNSFKKYFDETGKTEYPRST